MKQHIQCFISVVVTVQPCNKDYHMERRIFCVFRLLVCDF